MDQGQERHLEDILNEAAVLIATKYRYGAAEHKTLLSDTPPADLLDFAIDEAIDQVTYLLTLRKQLKSITVHDALRGGK